MSVVAPNLFKQLGSWFASSTEDFFTASLAAMLHRNARFRQAFLSWLAPHLSPSEDLLSREWRIAAQVSRPSCRGEAVLDMILTSDGLELWFEHKTGANLGQYDDIDQLEKYLDAANRAMVGVSDGLSDVVWPTVPLTDGRPRIALFYITRKAKVVDINRYRQRLYRDDQPFGLTWPPAGHLRWRDLWSIAESTLGPAAQHASAFEQQLAAEFLSYWQSMAGMWKIAATGDWAALLPPYDTLPEAQPCPFDDLWVDLLSYARSRLSPTGIRPWRGYEQHIAIGDNAFGEVDTIYVAPVTQVGDLENWDKRLGSFVLRILLRRRGGAPWGEISSTGNSNDPPIRNRIVYLSGEQRIEVLAAVTDWPTEPDVEARRHAIRNAFARTIEAMASAVASPSGQYLSLE